MKSQHVFSILFNLNAVKRTVQVSSFSVHNRFHFVLKSNKNEYDDKSRVDNPVLPELNSKSIPTF